MNIGYQNTALLVMDMQSAVIRHLKNYSEITVQIAKSIAFARLNKIPVFFITVNFRPGMPEVSMNNKLFAASKARSAGTTVNMAEAMKIDEAVAPLPDDIIITKRRISAFTGSDLEVILRAKDIHHLILTGVSTSGVVLSTLREAADKDYVITVLSDCCSDFDDEVHKVLTTKVFPMQASVIPFSDWGID